MILFIIPEQLRNTYCEKLMEERIEVAYGQPCHSIHEDMTAQLFDEVCECQGLVVLPHPFTQLDETMVLLTKAVAQLRKKVYLYHYDNHSIVEAEVLL